MTVAAGTGFIINKDGLILTNNHVIDGATKIEVTLFGEEPDQSYSAKLVGRDQLTDSALIQLVEKPSHALPEAKFGDSSQMAAGDWVMAIGNPFSQGWTVTVGVISAMQRPFNVTDTRQSEMIQTDAAINPGNSGGPLLNLRGEVIGMNTAIISNGGTEGNIGIGFAVPINTVRELLPQLNTGKVTRGRIGVSVTSVPREGYEDFGLKSRSGALVSSVSASSAAEKGGVKPGDVIVEYNGRPVANTNELVKSVTATRPGTSVAVKVIRDKREQTLHVTVDELDLDAEQQGPRQSRNDNAAPPDQQGSDSFGLTLSNVTPQAARRLQLPSGRTGALVTDVDTSGPSAGALRQGDVIMSVNRQAVSSAADAGRELQRIPAGRIAQILVWRDGNEVFVTVKKD
jgi:serine protease Do